jgi:microcin C transport system permease protein
MNLTPSTWIHPVTRRRLQRFRSLPRAFWSFWILLGVYLVSLASECLCNDKPLFLRFEGRTIFPILRYTSERDLLGMGHLTRIDFKELVRSERFLTNRANRVLWPLIPYGPREIIQPASIPLPDVVQLKLTPEHHVATLQLSPDGVISRGVAAGVFFGVADGGEEGRSLADGWDIPAPVRAGLQQRFRNEAAPALVAVGRTASGQAVELSLPPYTPRAAPPRTVRITLREVAVASGSAVSFLVGRMGELPSDVPSLWGALSAQEQEKALALAQQRFANRVEPLLLETTAGRLRVQAEREEVRYPFRPVSGHPLGLDSAGRDVLARMLYGLRTSMTFGLLLTAVTLMLGTLFGALQGYYGGPVDIIGQRVIEVWDSLPFLYILMLMGSIYGRSFSLLLICYGLFNWIGISYYMRAEFLRLRRLPFVEAARALGLPGWKVMYRHILPNALVPLITFFPFSLVSAIGTLAALDFLGFGLPPPTPSWGDLLAQAQEYGWAWWLALYPSLALFVVMLLGVFVGEGVRQAFDPKPYGRME